METARTSLAKNWRHVSSIPIGQIPGNLSSAISLFASIARYEAQGGCSLASPCWQKPSCKSCTNIAQSLAGLTVMEEEKMLEMY